MSQMMTSPPCLTMIKYRGLDDTEHVSEDGTEINGAASQLTGQNGGCGEGLLPTNPQASVEEQGNEAQGSEAHKESVDNFGSHNTPNTLPTMENSCASQPISSTDTATEKASWCFVGQYTEGGKNKDGTYPLVEAQVLEGQLKCRIHNPKNPNHEDPVQWGRFVLGKETYRAVATTKEEMVKYVERKAVQ